MKAEKHPEMLAEMNFFINTLRFEMSNYFAHAAAGQRKIFSARGLKSEYPASSFRSKMMVIGTTLILLI
jgi:hypothetical protein